MESEIMYGLVEKAEDLKMLTTYITYVTGAIVHKAEMPKLVMGFNNPDIMDAFCSLCSAIDGVRKGDA